MRKVKFKVVKVDYHGRRHSIFAKGSYSLEYPKDVTVRAIPGTLGVAVFGMRRQAENFLVSGLDQKIIRVRPVGRGKIVKFVCDYPTEKYLDVFYRYRSTIQKNLTWTPPGTMFYPAVEVIE